MFVDDKAPGEQQTKADPLTLPNLIAWLEQQPADKVYCYTDHGRCLIGQYLTSLGYTSVSVYSNDWFSHSKNSYVELPASFDNVAIFGDRTFGGALKRAREYAAR